MSKDNKILGFSPLGVGALIVVGYFIWYKIEENKQKKKETLGKDAAIKEVAENIVVKETEQKFSNPLLMNYDVKLPAVQASKAVKEKSDILTAGRYAIRPKNIKPPMYI